MKLYALLLIGFLMTFTSFAVHSSINNKKISLSTEKEMWLKIIQANSLMNNIPVVVANRIGKETSGNKTISFWGSSFITNSDGQIIAKAGKSTSLVNGTISLLDRKKSIKKWGFSSVD